MDPKLGGLQTSLQDGIRRASQKERKRNRMFSAKSLNGQLRRRADDSKKTERLHYLLEGAVAKNRRAQKIVDYL